MRHESRCPHADPVADPSLVHWPCTCPRGLAHDVAIGVIDLLARPLFWAVHYKPRK